MLSTQDKETMLRISQTIASKLLESELLDLASAFVENGYVGKGRIKFGGNSSVKSFNRSKVFDVIKNTWLLNFSEKAGNKKWGLTFSHHWVLFISNMLSQPVSNNDRAYVTFF